LTMIGAWREWIKVEIWVTDVTHLEGR